MFGKVLWQTRAMYMYTYVHMNILKYPQISSDYAV